MGTITVTVCDICGKDATTTRTIDVCEDHGKSGLDAQRSPSRPSSRRATAYKFPKSKCPYCEREFAPQGMTPHIRTNHPEKLEEWRTEREATKSQDTSAAS